MRKNYEAPLIEVVEIEIEDAILAVSSKYNLEDFGYGVDNWGDDF